MSRLDIYIHDAKQTRYGGRLTTAVSEEAYKGYLMVVSPFNGTVSIKKDNHHIGYAKSIDDAKRIIDQLV